MAEVKHQITLNDVCTPETLANEYPELFTKSQINWLIKTRHKNGLAETGAILKISHKIYLQRTKLFEWFKGQKAV